VRDDVVEDVHAWDAGVAAPGDGLQRSDDYGGDGPECILQCLEWDDEPRGGAVCVGDDEALG